MKSKALLTAVLFAATNIAIAQGPIDAVGVVAPSSDRSVVETNQTNQVRQSYNGKLFTPTYNLPSNNGNAISGKSYNGKLFNGIS